MITLLKNVYALSWEQKLWLMPLYLLSAPAWILTLVMPYHKMGSMMGSRYRNSELVALASLDQQRRAWHLGRLVESLCQYTPWPAKCLVQALITRFALRCHGIPHVLYVGICKPKALGEAMPAHAWLCVDRWIVTGGDGHQAFSIVATFVSPRQIIE